MAATRSPNETAPSQFRLEDEILSLLDQIRDHHRLESRASAVRLSVQAHAEELGLRPKKLRKKSRRPS